MDKEDNNVPDNILNIKLYKQVKNEARAKYKRFPSAYASGWIVKTYKERGGRYKPERKTRKEPKPAGLNKWFRIEKWVQVLPYLEEDKIVECGSPAEKVKACRPLVRANASTPLTISELLELHGRERLIQIAKRKEENPNKRIQWGRKIKK